MSGPFRTRGGRDPEASYAPASFRDPAGTLIAREGRVLRVVNACGIDSLRALLASKTGRKHVDDGSLVATRVGDDTGDGQLLVEHERVEFPSYPYEWPAEMLHAAGSLTLSLAQELLEEGLGLKDATPYNVLFEGPRPVFVDVLSVERRDPCDPTWLAYAQFVRTFLLPLLVNKHLGLALDQLLAARRDGVEPQAAYRWLKPWQKLRPPFLTLVTIPTWLERGREPDDSRIYERRLCDSREKAAFILGSLFRGLRRGMRRAEPRTGRASTWSSYREGGGSYSAPQFAAKEEFVQKVLDEFRPKRILDIGCNTGHFSLLCCRSGARVVAIDADPVVVGETWRAAAGKRAAILPLVIDVARPSPALGWLNQECPSFLERARGSFDAVLMLAVIHHLLVSERIPLACIVDLAASLTRDMVVAEFIAPADPMFQRLTRGRGELHRDLTRERFESEWRRCFEIARAQDVAGESRRLYLLRRRERGAC